MHPFLSLVGQIVKNGLVMRVLFLFKYGTLKFFRVCYTQSTTIGTDFQISGLQIKLTQTFNSSITIIQHLFRVQRRG